jgi:hypothetical protein
LGSGRTLLSGRAFGRIKPVIAVALLTAVVLTFLVPNSSAHLPVFDTGGESYTTADRIGDLDTSYAFYGELPVMTPGSPAGAKYYVFEGKDAQDLMFEVGTNDFYFAPCVLLAGPGLPTPDEEARNIIESSDLDLPDGFGALGWSFVFLPFMDLLPKDEFEPFTQTTFYNKYDESVVLPSDGTYYLILTGVVYSEELGDYQVTSGKYFLVTGYEEKFAVTDFVLMPWYWSKVQSFWGQHGEITFLWPTAAVVALLMAAETLAWRKHGRFRDETRPMTALYFGGLAGSCLMIGGAVNQLSLLALYSPEHDWRGIVLLVLALQLAGLVLGVVSLGLLRSRFFRVKRPTLIAAAVITALALLMGAGLIVGPLLFLGCVTVAVFVGRGTGRGTT